MKGLIRNNFYSVGSALNWTIAFCIAINIAVAIGAVKYDAIVNLLPMLIPGQIGAFVGLTGTALQKDNASKWAKFERTLPVKPSEIIMARYLSFLIFSMIGVLFAGITTLLCITLSNQPINLERLGYGFSFGLAFAFLVPSFLYPLALRFGTDKSEVLLLASILITIGLFVGGSMVFAPYLKNYAQANLIYRVACIVISITLFIASSYAALAIYKTKEG